MSSPHCPDQRLLHSKAWMALDDYGGLPGPLLALSVACVGLC